MNRSNLKRIIPLLALLAVLIGTALRFTGLDGKVYWHDEVYTALRVSGYTSADYAGGAFTNRIYSTEELLNFQHPAAGSGIQGSLRGLMSRPEHGPLYYLLTRIGYRFTDDARLATRSVAAALSLLLFPAVMWLWRELFNERLGAWIILGLIALSPFQLVYAQEARQYSLWAVMTIAVCAALLRARRRDDLPAWALYALLLTIGLYTHLMLAVVVLVHGLWLLWESRAQFKSFALAVLAAVLLFSPWLWLFHSGLREVGHVTAWMQVVIPFERLANAWGLHLVRQFVDTATMKTPQPWLYGVLALLFYGLYRTARSAPVASKRLLFIMLVITIGIVVAPDLINGGRRSQEARYLFPALLMLMFMVAYGLAHALSGERAWPRNLAFGVWLGLLGLGLWSGLNFIQAETWWNKSMSSHNREVARLIDAGEHSLVICPVGDINPGEVLSVALEVDPRTRFILAQADYQPDIPHLQGDIFLINPTAEIKQQAERYGTVTEIHHAGRLWRFIPADS